jgi:hypothetical protein
MVGQVRPNKPRRQSLDWPTWTVSTNSRPAHPSPIEFDVLGIPKRAFTAQDTVAVTGYLAYSFAPAFRTDPALTYLRDKVGPELFAISLILSGTRRVWSGQSPSPTLEH